MSKKNKLRRTLAVTASVAIMGTSIPFNVLAESAMPTPTNVVGVTRNVNQEEWQRDDFIIEKDVVKGFSDKGKEKVKTNKNLVIPYGVKEIGEEAFKNNQLTSVVIPDSVTKIGGLAFYKNKLTELTLGNSVEKIGIGAFLENQLTNVTIPNSVVAIDVGAFRGNQLTSIEIPNSVKTIGFGAFQDNKLTSVTIPDSVVLIWGKAFLNNQLTSVTIPNSVYRIDECAFSGNKLTSVIIPNSVLSIGEQAFSNNQLTSVIIPNSVYEIEERAFENNQLTSVTIPDSVKTIGNSAFDDQTISFNPKENPFELKEAGISLVGRKEKINDISPFVDDYKELDKEKGKLSFPKNTKEAILRTKKVPDYQYSANITIHNPGKYVKDMGIITPVPTINKDDIEKEIVPWGKKVDLTDNIKNLPEGATVKDITDPKVDTKKSGEQKATVEVTFKDGSKRRVEVPVEVEKSEAENFTPEVKEADVKEGEKPNYEDVITNLPDGATVEEKEAPNTDKPGKTTGKVEITFPDGSTKEVEIPVKVVLEAGTITPVPTINKDDIEKEIVPWGKKVDLTDNIKNLPEGATVKDITDPKVDTKKSGEQKATVEVTFKDGSKRRVEVPVEVEKSEAENFTPEVKEADVKEGEKPNYEDVITNLPDGATVEEKEKPDTNKPGKTTGKVEITFPDGSTKEVEIPVKVVKEAGIITPVPTINKDDIEKEIVPWGKKVDLTDNIKNLPEGATVEDVTSPAIDTKKPGDYTGKAKINFKDGSSRVVEVPVEVEKSMADTFVPEVKEEKVTKGEEVDLTDNIDNLPDGAKVKDITDPKVDTNKPGKTTGKVEVTFPDGSTKEVEVPVKVIEDNTNICEDTEPLKKKIKDLEKELQEEKDKNKDLEDKIKNQEDKNKNLDDKIKDLEDKKKDIENKLEQEKSKTEQDQDKIKELEDKIADLEKQIEDQKKEKDKAKKDLEDLKNKLGDKDKEIADKDKQIKELKKLLEEAKKKSEEKPAVEDKKPSKEDTKPSTTNNNIILDLGKNDFEREYYRRNHDRLPFEIVYERETPGYTNYQENRLEYIFTIGSTVYQRIMGANTENRSMDVAPYIKNDRTMLPLRYVAEAIGAEVRWDNTTRTAYFTKDGMTAKIQIDQNKIEMSDGRIFQMDSKPDNIKGRIFVSLTNLSKVFNLTNGNTEDGIKHQIEWNRHNKQVSISLNR